MNRTVATSAMPIGMPGCPDFACSTASMASARIAFAMRRSFGSLGAGSGEAVAAEGGRCSSRQDSYRRRESKHADSARRTLRDKTDKEQEGCA